MRITNPYMPEGHTTSVTYGLERDDQKLHVYLIPKDKTPESIQAVRQATDDFASQVSEALKNDPRYGCSHVEVDETGANKEGRDLRFFITNPLGEQNTIITSLRELVAKTMLKNIRTGHQDPIVDQADPIISHSRESNEEFEKDTYQSLDHDNNGKRYTGVFYKLKNHPWLDEIMIQPLVEPVDETNFDKPRKGRLALTFGLKEPATPKEEQLVERKTEELIGHRNLFEGLNAAERETLDAIDFSAEPTSKIQQVIKLPSIGLSKKIQLEIETTLNSLWKEKSH